MPAVLGREAFVAAGIPSDPSAAFLEGLALAGSSGPAMIANSVAFGFFMGDWSSHIAAEWRVFVSARSRSVDQVPSRTWMLHFVKVLYAMTRLGAFLTMVTYLLVLCIGQSTARRGCAVTGKLLSIFTMVALMGAYGILALRCVALWRAKPLNSSRTGGISRIADLTHRAVPYLIFIFAMATAVTTISQIATISASAPPVFGPPPTPQIMNCLLSEPKQIESLPYWSAFAFDSTVFFIVWYRLLNSAAPRNLLSAHQDTSSKTTRVTETILRDNAAYYASVIIISLGSALLIVLTPVLASAYDAVLLSAAHVCVTCAMVCRLLLHLRMLDDETTSTARAPAATMELRSNDSQKNSFRTPIHPHDSIFIVGPPEHSSATSFPPQPFFRNTALGSSSSWRKAHDSPDLASLNYPHHQLEAFSRDPPVQVQALKGVHVYSVQESFRD